jgi:serine/threonine protein kinase
MILLLVLSLFSLFSRIHLAADGIVHRDLACRNLLLDKDYNCKITDFGFARLTNTDTYAKTSSSVGPLKWMSPVRMLNQSLFIIS